MLGASYKLLRRLEGLRSGQSVAEIEDALSVEQDALTASWAAGLARRTMERPERAAALSRRGRTAVQARWGPPRVVRLDDLTPEQRRLVIALVDAAKAANHGAPPSAGTLAEPRPNES